MVVINIQSVKHSVEGEMSAFWLATHQLVIVINIIFGEGIEISGAE